MKPVALMTEEERLKEIGELLATAALRYLSQQPPQPPRNQEPIQSRVEVWDLVDDEIEKQVLRYLTVNILVSPGAIERALSIPHVTLAKRLSRLRAAGFIQVSGRTRRAQYSLAGEHGTN